MAMILKKGKSMNLPGNTTFTGGVGWAAKGGVGVSPDLDLWVIRTHSTGLSEVVFWGNQDWHRPKLGVNHNPETGEENPWVATPELDVIYKGDDRTGAGSKGGYDENVDLDFSKAPDTVLSYHAFVTIYDENEAGLTLGVAQDIICGVKDTQRGTELQTELGEEHGFDVTAYIAKWERNADNPALWTMTGVHEGYPDDMFVVAKREFGVDFPAHWQG